MEQNKKALDQLIDLLKEQGSSEDQITDFLARLSNDVAQAIYIDSMNNLTEEDLKAIEATKVPEQADFEIRQRYHKRTGKNPDKVAAALYEDFAKKFLESYHKHHNKGSSLKDAAKQEDSSATVSPSTQTISHPPTWHQEIPSNNVPVYSSPTTSSEIMSPVQDNPHKNPPIEDKSHASEVHHSPGHADIP